MGLVVDYLGIKSNMNIALAKYSKYGGEEFDEIDQTVAIVKDQLDLLNRLFHKFDASKYYNGTPLEKLRCLNRAAEFVQMTEEIEKRFMAIAYKLRGAYDLSVTSEKITQQERDQIHFYFAVRSIVFKLTKGNAPDLAQMNARVTEMIHEALQSEGIEEIFKLDKNNPEGNADIFSDEYMAKIEKIELPNTKIKLLQMLLKKAIDEFKKVNKIKGVDFSKRLKRLVEIYNERKDFETFKSEVMDDIAEQFANLFKDLQVERESFLELGINFEEKAFYDILKAIAEKYKFEYPEDKLIALSKAVKVIVDDKAKYTDWAKRDQIKAELQVALILTLEEHGFPPVPQDEIYKEIFEQAENFKKYIDNETVSIGEQEFTLSSDDLVIFFELTFDIDPDDLTPELLESYRNSIAAELDIPSEDIVFLGYRPGSSKILTAIKHTVVSTIKLLSLSIAKVKMWYSIPERLTFVSYAHEDYSTVKEIIDFLDDRGFNPWYDKQNIFVGERWWKAIEQAIERSTAFLLCLSQTSTKPRSVLQAEIEKGLGKLKTLPSNSIYFLPVRIDNCDVPAEFADRQWHDWNHGKEPDVLANSLLEGLRRHIEERDKAAQAIGRQQTSY